MSIQTLDRRAERARRMLEDDVKPRVIGNLKGQFFVPCANDSHSYGYLTTIDSCTCSDFIFRKRPCKHIFLVQFTR